MNLDTLPLEIFEMARLRKDIMNLDTLPLEIFEMVIESVCFKFVDLPYLLQVSKGIQVPPH
jgi:hypothetical protein